MAWNRQRRVFAGVLAVAGAALVADRVFFGAAPLGVETAEATQEGGPAKAAAATPAQSAAVPGVMLSQRLESFRDRATDADPFVSPLVTLAAVEPADIEEQSPTPVFDAAAWAGGRRLTAVLNGRSGSVAMIDGKVYRVGDTLDGLTLVRIESQVALFEGDGAAAELSVRATEPR
jgi:hypothetical protein